MQAVMTNARDRATGAMAGVYMYFGLSLLLTMVTTLFFNSTGITGFIVQSKVVLYTFLFAPLGIFLVLGFLKDKLSFAGKTALFVLYSVVQATPLVVVAALKPNLVGLMGNTLMITALAFGVMSVFGLVTKVDMTSIGGFLWYALIGVVVVSIANLFIGSSTLGLIVSAVAVLLFMAFIAYDTQSIAREMESASRESSAVIALYGALTLVIDFWALFWNLFNIMSSLND